MPRSSFAEMKNYNYKNPVPRKPLFQNRLEGPKFGQTPEKEQAKENNTSGTTRSLSRGEQKMDQMQALMRELGDNDSAMQQPVKKKKHWWQRRGKSEQKTETAGFKEYLDVQEKMRQAMEITKGSFSSDTTENKTMLREAAKVYVKLIDACHDYLKKSGNFDMDAEKLGLSERELYRKELIIKVLDLARDDISAIQKAKRQLGSIPKSQLNWQDILFSGREATIEVEDYYGAKAFGEANKTGDKASRGLDQGIFTKEVLNRVGEGGIESVKTGLEVAFDDSDIKARDSRLGIEESITGRNAAMSRMAELLGISGIIAGSETVKIKDKKTGKTFRGNLMKYARGEEGRQVEARESKNIADEVKDDIEKRAKKAISKFTPAVQRDLCSLQVLDYICGQNDRHSGNFFLSKDDGKYAGVQGIDNDMSFGTGTNLAKKNEQSTIGMASMDKMRSVVGPKGELSIPYMDNQLAKNIEALEETEIIDALEEFVGPMYIEATLKRFREVKNAIMKERSKKGTTVFKEDKDWNDQTAQDMLNQTFAMKSFQKKEGGHMYFEKDNAVLNRDYNEYAGNSTYFGEMLLRTMGYSNNQKHLKFMHGDEIK